MHECRGLNMILDPEKITEVDYAEMADMFKRVTGAAHAHVFHHLLRADRHNADGNGFNISPAPRLTLLAFFSLLQNTQRTSTMCPTAGVQALTMSSLMSWYPCLSGPALHCRVPFSPFCACFFSKNHKSQAFRSFFT